MSILKQVNFRKDKYSVGFYIKKNNKIQNINLKNNRAEFECATFSLEISESDNLLKYSIDITASADLNVDSVGLRLGVDSYMDKFPDWDDKFFPTALRCERKGFWGCFMSPQGKMLGVASPNSIVSWNNCYNRTSYGDVGHRIYTSAVEFASVHKQPERHPIKTKIAKGDNLHYEIYFSIVDSKIELYEFVKKYANLNFAAIENFVLEKTNTDLPYGRNIISAEGEAECSIFVRKDWYYYLECAAKSARLCQQKPGTHVESWYGFYTMAAYAMVIKDTKYTKALVKQFDEFFQVLTKGNVPKFRQKAAPHRLQNMSGMLSLLANMYDLTKDDKYLDHAEPLAEWLISLQSLDGSYRSHGTHYTCVIYPAKSMLDLSITERNAGRIEIANRHYDSAQRAILNLHKLLDNIQTAGQMTFEDGMITCEALQLALLALHSEGNEREELTQSAEYIMTKHRCLEQQLIPDCRTIGATLRFWEARYDINFNSNMLNSPHGWTSWKTYATYYLYMLTGKLDYLRDTMNTLGACMQVIDDNGTVWAFVPDPCIIGKQMLPDKHSKTEIKFVEKTVSEEYMPMVSNWYRQNPNKLRFQYLRQFKLIRKSRSDYGGSCDNDVNEHFKCLFETVFGKSFIHIEENTEHLYNCTKLGSEYISNDKYVTKFVVHSPTALKLKIQGKEFNIKSGITEITL